MEKMYENFLRLLRSFYLALFLLFKSSEVSEKMQRSMKNNDSSQLPEFLMDVIKEIQDDKKKEI